MEDSSRARRYHRTRRILSVTAFCLDLALLGALLFTGWTRSLRDFSQGWSTSPPLSLLVYLVMFGFVTQLIGLPLEFVRGFWLEHRYGLSNLTLAGWIKDHLKSVAVGGVLAVLAVQFLYWTMRCWPATWWIISGAAFVVFVVVLTNLAPILIFPIFFKFRPLENPSLGERLLELSRRAGTRVRGVFEWKLSEKSQKANAALVGLGNTRRILLADTLLEKFTEHEVEAVLAHEFGHHVHRHVFRGMTVQAAAAFLAFAVVNEVLLRFAGRFGFQGLADFANLPLLVLASVGLSLLLLPAVNAHSRHMERQADAYALAAIPDRAVFISSMEKLAELNLAERRPSAWIEFLFHSHPSIEKRIAFARSFRLDSTPQGGLQ